MKVRNNYTTHVGLGSTRVLPGETIDLDTVPGYSENHPVVKWYIARGWLVVVGKGNSKGKSNNAVNVNVGVNTGGSDGGNGGNEKMRLDPKQFDGWETEQIFNLAADMGIELGDAPERDDVIAKIAAEEVEVSEYTDLNPEDYNTDGDDGQNGDNAPVSELAKKNVDRLTLDELKTLAGEMKLEVVEADTRKTLIEKIKAAKKTGE